MRPVFSFAVPPQNANRASRGAAPPVARLTADLVSALAPLIAPFSYVSENPGKNGERGLPPRPARLPASCRRLRPSRRDLSQRLRVAAPGCYCPPRRGFLCNA